ncbi:hypothetical protein BDY24DRAFT_270936 [Mrakia frigida]|uniref:uncharacterized protein n=1 Tax=Mrakia frigida TaxID=29902 RepID=UPI003FCC135B
MWGRLIEFHGNQQPNPQEAKSGLDSTRPWKDERRRHLAQPPTSPISNEPNENRRGEAKDEPPEEGNDDSDDQPVAIRAWNELGERREFDSASDSRDGHANRRAEGDGGRGSDSTDEDLCIPPNGYEPGGKKPRPRPYAGRRLRERKGGREESELSL